MLGWNLTGDYKKSYKSYNKVYSSVVSIIKIKMKEEEIRRKMVKTGWFKTLKEYYESEDVIRYYKEVEEIMNTTDYKQNLLKIAPVENFFTEEVLKQGLELLKQRDLDTLKKELEYLKQVKIPQLEKLINNYK